MKYIQMQREEYTVYLSGLSLRESAINAGKVLVHSSVKRILENEKYIPVLQYHHLRRMRKYIQAADDFQRCKLVLQDTSEKQSTMFYDVYS